MIVYVENLIESTKELLELIYEFSKVATYKVHIKNQLYFYILMQKSDVEIKNNTIYNVLVINLTKDMRLLH